MVRASRPHDPTAVDEVRAGRPHHNRDLIYPAGVLVLDSLEKPVHY